MKKTVIPVGVSGRHVHLTSADVETLFGEGAKLEEDKPLRQTGQFSAKQRVDIIGPKGELPGVAIIGPERDESVAEIAMTDGYRLGVELGEEEGYRIKTSGPITLRGPAGEVELNGADVTLRHIHISPNEAMDMGLSDGDKVSVETGAVRRVIFENVLVRVRKDFRLELQIDTDEANAALVQTGDEGYIIENHHL